MKEYKEGFEYLARKLNDVKKQVKMGEYLLAYCMIENLINLCKEFINYIDDELSTPKEDKNQNKFDKSYEELKEKMMQIILIKLLEKINDKDNRL